MSDERNRRSEPLLAQVWRVRFPSGGKPGRDSASICREAGLIGVGGRAPSDPIAGKMCDGDLCWTRDSAGIYYLCRPIGPWRRASTREFLSHGIGSIRNCEWVEVGLGVQAPSKVVSGLMKGASIRRIPDSRVEVYSKCLFNRLTKSDFRYLVKRPHDTYLLSLLDAEECLDLVVSLLQFADQFQVIPSSITAGDPRFQCVMINLRDGSLAAVHIGKRNEIMRIEDYRVPGLEIFLFANRGRYMGKRVRGVTCLEPPVVMTYVTDCRDALPPRIRLWKEFGEGFWGIGDNGS